MARLFIIAVGGTGARVLRSLTMLLAAGLKLPDCELVVPVLVDPDTQNGDVNRTVALLKRYETLHKALHADGQPPRGEGFFNQPLTTLSQLNTAGTEGLSDSFVYDFGGISKSFKEYVQYNEASVETQGLLDLLFTPDALNASLDLGFRGSPNVGAVVLNSLVQAKEMRYLAQSLNPDDRVFFICSIFGGTGAAGFPLLVRNLRDPDSGLPQPSVRASVKAGALVLLPYFKLQQPSAQEKADGKEHIDSNAFITKTKTALGYYADHLHGVEAMYYLGDQAGQPLPNNPGRAEQKNQAHLLEMLGALAIPHFLAQPASQLDPQNPAFHEFGLKGDTQAVDFSHFSSVMRRDVARPLIKLHYFARYFRHYLTQQSQAPFFSDGKLGAHLPATTGPLADLTELLEGYEAWLRELGTSERRFAGLKPDEKEFNKMVTDQEIKTSFFDNGLTESTLRTELNSATDKRKLANPDAAEALRWLVRGFDQATTNVMDKKLKFS